MRRIRLVDNKLDYVIERLDRLEQEPVKDPARLRLVGKYGFHTDDVGKTHYMQVLAQAGKRLRVKEFQQLGPEEEVVTYEHNLLLRDYDDFEVAETLNASLDAKAARPVHMQRRSNL